MIEVSSIYGRQRLCRGQGPVLAVMIALALPGCTRTVNGAVDLYHGLEGGPIAEQRPPPPGVDAPYPNLGTTPARPAAPDLAAEARIGDTLAAQRDAATAAAAKDPLKALPPAVPPPPKPAAADPNSNKVVVDAAPSPPPSPAPAKPPATVAPSLDNVPALAAAVQPGPLPELAGGPPPSPVGLGTPASAPPAPTPQVAAPTVPAVPNGVSVAFTPGSSVLPPSANLTIRRFAIAHRGVAIAVTGRGDGGGKTPEAQSQAMELGLKRAAAMAASLGASGVAPANIRLHADAIGTASVVALN